MKFEQNTTSAVIYGKLDSHSPVVNGEYVGQLLTIIPHGSQESVFAIVRGKDENSFNWLTSGSNISVTGSLQMYAGQLTVLVDRDGIKF